MARGYFACSVSKSQVATVRQYVVIKKSTTAGWISRRSSSCWRKNMDLRLALRLTRKLVVARPKGDLVFFLSFAGTPVPGSGFFRPFRDWFAENFYGRTDWNFAGSIHQRPTLQV